MLSNTKFQGKIEGKGLNDYKKKIDWDITDENKRLKLIEEIFNLDEIGSNDEFWQEVWDCGICKVNINTNDTRWEETNVAHFLETVGTYFMYGYDKKEKKKYNEMELNENMTMDDLVNDKNYRLAPPDKIYQSDYRVRDLFKGTYEDYVKKVSKTPYEIKEKESWERIKHNEEEKVKLLTEAKRNLDILKKQMEDIRKGKRLQYNKNVIIKVPKMNVDLRLSKQLEKYGLDNSDILKVEDKIYTYNTRSTNVMLWHLTDNLKSMKDYMISCKLSYINRVKIKPPKCPTVHNILEKIDYLDTSHVKAMLTLGEKELDPSNDLAVIANDINKKIKEMHSLGELSDREIYIIEGLRYNVPYETLGKELGIRLQNVEKALNRICDNIAKSFYEDYMNWYFLNMSKGKYKKCSRCGEIKLTNQFDKDKKGKYGVRGYCKSCYNRKK